MTADNNSVRTQILLETLNEASNHHDMAPDSKKESKSWRNKIQIGILMIVGIFFLGYIVISILQKPFYAVIIDAGSTGSRVYAFSFHKSILNANLVLDSQLFEHIEPGLSSFSDDPVKGAKSLKFLLDKAKAFIPKSLWRHTPLSLKATAGLRLLPTEKANRLLHECKKLFENSEFHTSEESVSMMDGTDEGIFFWITVNFLLGRLTAKNHKNTVAALDLGGGSTQVTFALDSEHIKDQEMNIFTINALNDNVNISIHSYLGMGLLAARRGILTYDRNPDKEDKNSSLVSTIELSSECVNPTISTNWSYGGINYLVKGSTNGTHEAVKTQNLTEIDDDRPALRFSQCLQIVKNYVGTIASKPLGLDNQEIVASSYYFKRAAKVRLIDSLNGGLVKVDDFLKQAMVYCDYPNIEEPFMCLDLTFIYVLLSDGFNLQPTNELQLLSTINNYRISWALGAAFNILQNKL